MVVRETNYDVAIVGGGIVGLAHAYEAVKAGLSVILFERNPKALGATIRNFGMVWPIGQPEATFDRAMRARETWLELSQKAGFWAKEWGSLHLAYHEDELHVMEEFVAKTRHVGYQCQMLTPEETVYKSKAVRPIKLEGAMYSATEVNIDPREATIALHRYFQEELNVTIVYQTAIHDISYPYLFSGEQKYRAERIFVCSGADLETLYPEIMADSGIIKCKLQMMRTKPQPDNFQLGPNLAAGLTLQHYASFAVCDSLQLLKDRFARELPAYNKWGIHVMLSQTAKGELTIGDSHEYGADPSPFDKKEINELILKYLKRFAQMPDPEIAETWHGVYPKLAGKTEFIAQPEENVTIVNGLGGAGMTLSFGLAQEVMAGNFMLSTKQ